MDVEIVILKSREKKSVPEKVIQGAKKEIRILVKTSE